MNDERDAVANEEAIRLERLELALKASNEGIWDWWTASAEIYYSSRIREFFDSGDKRPAPHLFLPPHDAIHPDDQPDFQQAVAQALMDGGPETLAVDVRVRSGAGDWRWLRIRGTVVRTAAGKTCRIAGSMIDISRRKDAEAQVEDERFLLRQLLDHIPLQVYFKDLESRFVMVNKGMADWMGLADGSDLIGKHDRDFFDEDHWQPAEKDEHTIMETGLPITGQIEHETWRVGAETWVVTSKFPWRDRHGRIKGTFGVSSDVTNLVKAQRQATHLAIELQQKNQTYEEELHLAREIQQALTGKGFPVVTNGQTRVAFRSRYIPITGLAGDFFEVIHVRPDCASFLICDVMGHGVRSALIVAMLRGLLEKQRSQASEAGIFLRELNDGLTAILARAGTTMFATAFYGTIDLAAGTFSYACAGHPGPIIDGPDGVRQLATERFEKGPGLGLVRGSTFPTTTIPLASIKRMILFTDGILEAENPSGEPFFDQRLKDIIARNTGQALDTTLDAILATVLDFAGTGHFEDDVCLLGVELGEDGGVSNGMP